MLQKRAEVLQIFLVLSCQGSVPFLNLIPRDIEDFEEAVSLQPAEQARYCLWPQLVPADIELNELI